MCERIYPLLASNFSENFIGIKIYFCPINLVKFKMENTQPFQKIFVFDSLFSSDRISVSVFSMMTLFCGCVPRANWPPFATRPSFCLRSKVAPRLIHALFVSIRSNWPVHAQYLPGRQQAIPLVACLQTLVACINIGSRSFVPAPSNNCTPRSQ